MRTSSRRMRVYDANGNAIDERRAYVGSVNILR
jgi:hypothetical protein